MFRHPRSRVRAFVCMVEVFRIAMEKVSIVVSIGVVVVIAVFEVLIVM